MIKSVAILLILLACRTRLVPAEPKTDERSIALLNDLLVDNVASNSLPDNIKFIRKLGFQPNLLLDKSLKCAADELLIFAAGTNCDPKSVEIFKKFANYTEAHLHPDSDRRIDKVVRYYGKALAVQCETLIDLRLVDLVEEWKTSNDQAKWLDNIINDEFVAEFKRQNPDELQADFRWMPHNQEFDTKRGPVDQLNEAFEKFLEENVEYKEIIELYEEDPATNRWGNNYLFDKFVKKPCLAFKKHFFLFLDDASELSLYTSDGDERTFIGRRSNEFSLILDRYKYCNFHLNLSIKYLKALKSD